MLHVAVDLHRKTELDDKHWLECMLGYLSCCVLLLLKQTFQEFNITEKSNTAKMLLKVLMIALFTIPIKI